MMKTMKHPYLWAALAAVLTACAVEEPSVPDGDVSKVIFRVPRVACGDGDAATRVSLVPVNDEPSFRWEATDTVGIFPGSGSQVYFCMTDGAGTQDAEFDGGAWKLRGGNNYRSYYPYVGNTYLDPERIPVSFTGQRQTGLSSSGGFRNYYVAQCETISGGNLSFTYDMVNTMVRVIATLPAGTYTKASLSLDDALFVSEGTCSLSSPSITGERFARRIEVALDHFVVSQTSAVSIYFSLAPVDLRGKTVTVEVESSDGTVYRCDKNPSRQYEAGFWYSLTCTMASPEMPTQNCLKIMLWPNGAMPETLGYQIAATAEEAAAPDFDASAHQYPYLFWYDTPAQPNGACALLLTGDDYMGCPDRAQMDNWAQELTARGIQCVGLVYRTPRSTVHFCRSAWFDAQRALRIIRTWALLNQDNKGFVNSENIGVVGVGAGAHLGVMLATCSQTMAYPVVDDFERVPVSCHINWAILHAPVYCTSDSNTGTYPIRDGYGPDVTLDPIFQFDSYTCPVSFSHGEFDRHTPRASTLMYRRWRTLINSSTNARVPAEVHLYPTDAHGAFPLERGLEFLTQLGFMGTLQPEVNILDRYNNDSARGNYKKEYIWPEGKTPDFQLAQSVPYIEWHFPRTRRSKAIQIIYSCGSYLASDPMSFDVASARRYLNEKGVTVVTLNYRVQRPVGLAKHLSAWQDLQRTIRLVRSQAASYGLDPDRIGIMGASAGGHLTLMGVTSSRHPAYAPIDAIDQISCKVQWGIASCPAYALTDGMEDSGNTTGGNADSAILVPEFSFDLDTAPMLLLHGDADDIAAMNSVKVWEKLQSMGIPAELHTFATRPHTFQRSGSPGTGSYNWLDRVGEFLEPRL